MRTLLQAGADVQRVFVAEGWRFCFNGGVANFRWDTPRLTNDLDLTLLTGFAAEAQIWQELAELAELNEEPSLLDDLEHIVRRTESVVGSFPHARLGESA